MSMAAMLGTGRRGRFSISDRSRGAFGDVREHARGRACDAAWADVAFALTDALGLTEVCFTVRCTGTRRTRATGGRGRPGRQVGPMRVGLD